MEWFPDCKVGGLDRYFYEQIQAFSLSGVQGSALLSSCDPTSLGSIDVRPMAPRGASLLRRWKGVSTQARDALHTGVDAVNSHFALYAFPWVHKISRKTPLVVNFQGPWAEEMTTQADGWKSRLKGMIARQIERRVYRRADRVITLSDAFRDLVHRDYGVPLSAIRVVPGASHLAPFLDAPPRLEARRELGWPADRIILLSVRRLAKRMGLDMLIDAVAELRQEFPRLLLLIGGKGPERESLQAKIVKLGLEENVRLLGFIPEEDLPKTYAAADLSIVPTLALEGFGLITVESLASGTPVLGTPVGATPEILRPLSPNLVFDAANPAAIVRGIGSALHESLQMPSPAACRTHAQQYGWPVVAPKLLDIYREAIEECRNR